MRRTTLRRIMGLALLVLCLATAAPGRAAPGPVVLGRGLERVDLRVFVEVLPDQGYDIEQAASPELAGAYAPTGPDFAPGLYPRGCWLRFGLRLPRGVPWRGWSVYEICPESRLFTLYQPDGRGGWKAWEAGYGNEKRESWRVSEPFVCRLDPFAPGTETFYIHVQSEDRIFNDLPLLSASALAELLRARYLTFALFGGFALALMIYNLFLFTTLRDISYLWYVLLCASVTAYYLWVNGVPLEFVDSSPYWEITLNFLFLNLFMLFGVLFVRAFLRLRRVSRRLDRWYKILLGANGACLAATFAYGVDVMTIASSSLLLVLTVSHILAGVLSWRRGMEHARWFVLAWSVLFAAMFVGGLGGLGLVRDFSTLIVICMAGSALEMLLLSLALADRINALRRERTEAEARNQAKSRFLATMSHEIRTPINAIMGMNELAMSLAREPVQERCLATIRDASGHLLHVVNDILDFSKIEAGRLELEDKDFLLEDLVRSTMSIMEPQARAKGLELALDHKADAPACLRGDAFRLRQILFNLLSNAVRFTDRGEVRLEVDGEAQPRPGRAVARFSVHDTGPGIPANALESIFEHFTQADGSITREHGGAGLGLAISRKLARAMGGDVTVQSQPGRGSVFTIRVDMALGDPAACAALNGSAKPFCPVVRPVRVLVAEDNPLNRNYMELLFAGTPHTAVIVEDGAQAMEALRGSRFDIVFMDLEMPNMDGLEAARRIRRGEAGQQAANVPIVALSAHAVSDYRIAGRSVGMNMFLTKPVTPGTIHQVLDRLECPDTGAEDSTGPDLAARILEHHQVGRENVADLARAFLRMCPAYASKIERLRLRPEASALADLARDVRGSALILLADDLALASTILEQAADGDDNAMMQRALSRLGEELDRFKAEMETVLARFN